MGGFQMDNIEQQFLQLVNIVSNLQQRVIALENTNHVLLQSNNQLIKMIESNQSEAEWIRRNLYYEINDPRNARQELFYPIIETAENTIEEIVNNRKSLARFGDGEFSAIAGRIRHKFQTVVDEQLKQRLLEILNCEEEMLMVGIADNYGSLEKYSEQTQREIRCYLSPQIRDEHMHLLNPEKKYYDAYVTRPYIIYADNQSDAPAIRFMNLKRIWDNRDCVFVEGCYTGLGVGNDLFENANTIKRILCPAENAFLRYDEILDTCMKQDKDSLFLLALGPTATVLAYDLCRAGYQAVDIGHADLEYEWFIQGEGRRTPVAGKYNNEWNGEMQLEPIEDEEYRKQVVAEIGV